MQRKQRYSELTDDAWIERVSEIRQMVSDVAEAPQNKSDVDWYIEQFDLYSDEETIGRLEFERQYGIAS